MKVINRHSKEIFVEQFVDNSGGNFRLVRDGLLQAKKDLNLDAHSSFWLVVGIEKDEDVRLDLENASHSTLISVETQSDRYSRRGQAQHSEKKAIVFHIETDENGLLDHDDYPLDPPRTQP